MPKPTLADAVLRHPTLAARRADWSLSLNWIEKAKQYGAEVCRETYGKLLNLRMLVQLELREAIESFALVVKASDFNRDNPIELANTLRLTATASSQTGDVDIARKAATDALVIR